ncbi:hypothetical protein [Tunturiibacter gelidiferens]|uniref:hypothetical protein n=1 Tax=Tunturiibacter gelidiferens TaxID=3069689 RepID=UPI003D9BCBD7
MKISCANGDRSIQFISNFEYLKPKVSVYRRAFQVVVDLRLGVAGYLLFDKVIKPADQKEDFALTFNLVERG